MLLWKDYRMNRLVLVMGVTLLLGPYVVTPLGAWYSQTAPPGAFRELRFWAGLLLMSSIPSLVFSELTIALLAANAVACERVDRSAEFLAYLPPSRARVLTSKAILVWSSAALVWGVNLLVIAAAPFLSANGKQEFDANLSSSLPEFFVTTVATGVLLLGAGWLASCVLDSPPFASGIGIAAPLLLFCSFQIINYLFGWPHPDHVQAWYTGSSFLLGLLCFASGTLYYLRRVEP
jgi:ABC-type transport system involved in multi-copper enzyme maturation permease subunit